jgi:hypothetical protein
MTQIQHYKTRDEFTPDEELAFIQAQRAGQPTPRFETDTYREARREALEDAGLDPGEEDTGPIELDEMTVEQHYRRIRSPER